MAFPAGAEDVCIKGLGAEALALLPAVVLAAPVLELRCVGRAFPCVASKGVGACICGAGLQLVRSRRSLCESMRPLA